MEEQRVRICDIADELGLSTATVSNVIHGKTKNISDATVNILLKLERKVVSSIFNSSINILRTAVFFFIS